MQISTRPFHDRMAFLDLFYKKNEEYQRGYEPQQEPSSAQNLVLSISLPLLFALKHFLWLLFINSNSQICTFFTINLIVYWTTSSEMTSKRKCRQFQINNILNDCCYYCVMISNYIFFKITTNNYSKWTNHCANHFDAYLFITPCASEASDYYYQVIKMLLRYQCLGKMIFYDNIKILKNFA